MFCSNCGNAVNPQQKFCPFCGQALAVASVRNTGYAAPQPVSNIQVTSRIRQEELRQMDNLLSYFSLKQQQYNEYDRVSAFINESNHVCMVPALVWGIILSVIGLYMGIYLGIALTGALLIAVVLILLFCSPGTGLILLYVFRNIKRTKDLSSALIRYHQLAEELTNHYNAYINCPIGPEYTNPSNLDVVRRTIISGRADTVKEALNILVEDAHRSRMEDLSLETAQYAASAASSARVAAVFTVANYFK